MVVSILAKIIAPLIGSSDDHDWVSTFTETRVALINGDLASGSLMMRVLEGETQYRNMTPDEQIGHLAPVIETAPI
jgi:hypothetical protein